MIGLEIGDKVYVRNGPRYTLGVVVWTNYSRMIVDVEIPSNRPVEPKTFPVLQVIRKCELSENWFNDFYLPVKLGITSKERRNV